MHNLTSLYTGSLIKLFVATLVAASAFVFLQVTFAQDVPTRCHAGDVIKHTGSESEITYTGPEDKVVTGVCLEITDGEQTIHSDVLDRGFWHRECYRVGGIGGQTAHVVRTSDGCPDLVHMDVFLEDLRPPRPSPSINPSVSPRPRPSPSYTPRPSVSPNPSPSTEPEVSPSPTITPNFAIQTSVDGPYCTNYTFKANVHAEENGSPAKDHDVEFKYNNETKKTKTDANGNSSVDFGYVDNVDKIDITVSPWDTVTQGVVKAQNCPPGGGGGGTGGTNIGDVLGATAGSQVLGATTLAGTGSINDKFMYTVFAAGILLTITGTLSHVYATRKAKKA